MVFMPAFVVMLIANFIFNPILTTYAELWLESTRESIAKLKKQIIKQMLFILALTVLGLAIAATIGIPVLSVIFGVDLAGYKTELCIVMLGGGALAYATYFSTVITVIRLQKTLIVCYGIIALAAKLLSKFFVLGYGIAGAAGMYAFLMTILAAMLFGITWHEIRKESMRLRKR